MTPEEIEKIINHTLQDGISINLIYYIILVAVAFLGSFFGAYFKRKGENLATKEDIGDITKKVEAIRTEFIDKTEVLKANLQLLSETRLSLISLERDALINFHEKYFRWIRMSTETNLGDIGDFAQERIDNFLEEMDKSKFQVDRAEANMELLVDDNELIKLKNHLTMKTLEIYLIAREYLPKLKPIYAALKASKQDRSSLPTNRSLMEEYKKVYGEYSFKIVEHYENIIPVQHEFRKKSREYLNRIFTKSEA